MGGVHFLGAFQQLIVNKGVTCQNPWYGSRGGTPRYSEPLALVLQRIFVSSRRRVGLCGEFFAMRYRVLQIPERRESA